MVYKGVVRKTDVAIKIPRNTLSEKQVEDFRKEVAILSSVFHPNICLFLGAYVGQSEIIIVNELLEGNVAELVANPNFSLSTTQKLRMNLDAALGLSWLHGSGIVHRDIKPSNYLFKRLGEASFQIKVCDFGLSDLNNGAVVRESNPKGTPLYMAPEVLLSKPLNEKVDVYSWAVTLWEIVTGQEPYSQISSVEKLVKFVCIDHQRPVLPPTWGASLSKLMAAAWHSQPDQRPSFEEIASRMRDVLVESSIHDLAGQLFWKSCFSGGRDTIPFREFAEHFFAQFPSLRGKLPEQEESAAMSGYVGEVKMGSLPLQGARLSASFGEHPAGAAEGQLRIHFLRLMRLLFVDDASNEAVVNLEYFGKVLDWVGPIESEDPFLFFFRLARLYAKPWFFGGIRTQDATSLLLTKPPGTYLVRFCNNAQFPGFYVLSTVTVSGTGTVVAHVRIRHRAGDKFSLEKIQNTGAYDTLEELIEGCAAKLNLRKACPNRKYEYAVFEHLQDELKALELDRGRSRMVESSGSAMEMSGEGL